MLLEINKETHELDSQSIFGLIYVNVRIIISGRLDSLGR